MPLQTDCPPFPPCLLPREAEDLHRRLLCPLASAPQGTGGWRGVRAALYPPSSLRAIAVQQGHRLSSCLQTWTETPAFPRSWACQPSDWNDTTGSPVRRLIQISGLVSLHSLMSQFLIRALSIYCKRPEYPTPKYASLA